MAKGVVIGGLNSGSGGGVIKNIQRGIATKLSSVTFVDIPINAVDITKSIVIVTSRYVSGSSVQGNTLLAKAKLINSTTLRISTNATGAEISTAYQVIEFEKIKSLQTGDFIHAGGDITLPITTVNIGKSMLYFSFSTENIANSLVLSLTRGSVESTTQIKFSNNVATNFSIQWYLVELE